MKQFSVFSNLFLLAQLRKIINAPEIEDMREGKEILANELGVIFKPPGAKPTLEGCDPDVVSSVGSVEGGIYSHRAAHFEWLLDVGKPLGLEFQDLGKRAHGSPATLHFCDKLYEIYGSDDSSVSLGASFAIEHWANAGSRDDSFPSPDRISPRETAHGIAPEMFHPREASERRRRALQASGTACSTASRGSTRRRFCPRHRSGSGASTRSVLLCRGCVVAGRYGRHGP